MIVKEMSSYIGCTHCDYGFMFSTMATHQRLETIYDTLFKACMGSCPRCAEGQLSIRRAKFRIKPTKQRYILRWQCPECKREWTQYEYAKLKDISIKGLKKYFLEDNKTYCPYNCNSTEKKLIAIAEG